MEEARAAMKFAPSGLQQMVRAPHAGPLRKVLRYTAPFMSFTSLPITAARATAFQGMGIRVVLRLDVRPGIDVSRRAETLGNGRQRNTFGEQLAVPVIKSVHGVPLLVLVRLRLRRLRLVFRGFAVIGKIQRSFLTTGRNKAGDRDERSNRRDQALHGEIL